MSRRRSTGVDCLIKDRVNATSCAVDQFLLILSISECFSKKQVSSKSENPLSNLFIRCEWIRARASSTTKRKLPLLLRDSDLLSYKKDYWSNYMKNPVEEEWFTFKKHARHSLSAKHAKQEFVAKKAQNTRWQQTLQGNASKREFNSQKKKVLNSKWRRVICLFNSGFSQEFSNKNVWTLLNVSHSWREQVFIVVYNTRKHRSHIPEKKTSLAKKLTYLGRRQVGKILAETYRKSLMSDDFNCRTSTDLKDSLAVCVLPDSLNLTKSKWHSKCAETKVSKENDWMRHISFSFFSFVDDRKRDKLSRTSLSLTVSLTQPSSLSCDLCLPCFPWIIEWKSCSFLSTCISCR